MRIAGNLCGPGRYAVKSALAFDALVQSVAQRLRLPFVTWSQAANMAFSAVASKNSRPTVTHGDEALGLPRQKLPHHLAYYDSNYDGVYRWMADHT
jgi:hypothetical protein